MSIRQAHQGRHSRSLGPALIAANQSAKPAFAAQMCRHKKSSAGEAIDLGRHHVEQVIPYLTGKLLQLGVDIRKAALRRRSSCKDDAIETLRALVTDNGQSAVELDPV